MRIVYLNKIKSTISLGLYFLYKDFHYQPIKLYTNTLSKQNIVKVGNKEWSSSQNYPVDSTVGFIHKYGIFPNGI